jgi:tight adherence protein C
MSELYLLVALAGTFGAILVAGRLFVATRTDRNRTMEMLATNVGPVPVSLRDRSLADPFGERVLRPAVGRLAALARRLTPAAALRRVGDRLVLAGSPAGWDAERVIVMRFLATVVGLLLGVAVATSGVLHGLARLVVPFAMGGIGYMLPGAILGQAVLRRQEAIRRALPDTLDLLTISVEAGLGFDSALLHVTRNVPGPLAQEIGRMLHEMQLGVSRVEAFRHLADRTNVEELRGFVLAMVQADVLGVSIGKVLRAQAHEHRVRRRQNAEERAMKIPVKLLFPMIFCILPLIMIVVAGPAVIKIFHALLGPGGLFSPPR